MKKSKSLICLSLSLLFFSTNVMAKSNEFFVLNAQPINQVNLLDNEKYIKNIERVYGNPNGQVSLLDAVEKAQKHNQQNQVVQQRQQVYQANVSNQQQVSYQANVSGQQVSYGQSQQIQPRQIQITQNNNRVTVVLPPHQQANNGQQKQYYDKLGDFVYNHVLQNKHKQNGFILPVKYTRITSDFGLRFHPIHKVIRNHTGVDYAAPTGTPVKSARAGKVIFAGWKGGYGNTIIVRHDDRYSTLYGHLETINTTLNAQVNQGDFIGKVGSTGDSTGPHLHFEILENGKHIDPKKFI